MEEGDYRLKPNFTSEEVMLILWNEFEWKPTKISSLYSYDDQNWKVNLNGEEGERNFLLKISYKGESEGFIT